MDQFHHSVRLVIAQNLESCLRRLDVARDRELAEYSTIVRCFGFAIKECCPYSHHLYLQQFLQTITKVSHLVNSRYPNQFLELYQLSRGAWPATFDQKNSIELGPFLLAKYARFTLLTLGLFGFVLKRQEPFATK